MSHDKISFEKLNAYVDGELEPVEAAEVARAVADDIHLADQVSALSSLRSAVMKGFEAPYIKMPAPVNAGRRQPAIAACFAILLFVAGSVFMSSFDRALNGKWLLHAWELHHGWSINQPVDGHAGLLPTRFTEALAEAYIPDLSASKLSLVHATVLEFSNSWKTLLVGYRGTRGCKVSLVAFAGPQDLGETLRFIRERRNEAYVWRAGSLAYVLMSDGMDSKRFRLLAESVRHTSRQRLPFDKRAVIALRQSRDKSAPCLA
jgi:anti-sigma factor RsiW